MVQDRIMVNNIGAETAIDLNKFYAHTFEVYIGNDPLWSNNPKCPGGPHLKRTFDDYHDNWAYREHGKNTSPAFGFEVWCNMAGRYTFFVATGVPSVKISICSIAVFGTRYIRAQTLTTYFVIQAGS